MCGCRKVNRWIAEDSVHNTFEINLLFNVSERESVFKNILSHLKVKLSNREIKNITNHVKNPVSWD
jgi:hypothetical protein